MIRVSLAMTLAVALFVLALVDGNLLMVAVAALMMGMTALTWGRQETSRRARVE